MPAMLACDFALEALDSAGTWQRIHLASDNHERLVKVPLDLETSAIRFVPLSSWGSDRVHLMAFDVK